MIQNKIICFLIVILFLNCQTARKDATEVLEKHKHEYKDISGLMQSASSPLEQEEQTPETGKTGGINLRSFNFKRGK